VSAKHQGLVARCRRRSSVRGFHPMRASMNQPATPHSMGAPAGSRPPLPAATVTPGLGPPSRGSSCLA
jgi:hypothetical protein